MGKDLRGKELGEGFRQKKNGTYSARFVDRFGIRKELYDKDLKELRRRYNTALYDDRNGHNVVDMSTTLDMWFKQWIEVYKYNVIREHTRVYYTSLYEKHIKPVLGKNKLTDITQLKIKTLINDLDKRGYGYETQNKVRIVLLDMFEKALINNYVLKNPCKGIKLVRNDEKDIRVLTVEEQILFFECCKGTFYDNLFVVAVNTGLRQGELCALTWEDIDFKNKVIHVTKTLLYQRLENDTKKEFHLDPPKTKTSFRDVPINKQCEQALKKQFVQRNSIMMKRTAKPLPGYENLLFTTKFGTPICDQLMIDSIDRIVNEINLTKDELEQFESFTPHCFRHTFATRCFESGISAKTVQAYLGHASIKMTMDLYTHVMDDQKQSEMEKLEQTMDQVFDNSEKLVEDNYKALNDKQKMINRFKTVG